MRIHGNLTREFRRGFFLEIMSDSKVFDFINIELWSWNFASIKSILRWKWLSSNLLFFHYIFSEILLTFKGWTSRILHHGLDFLKIIEHFSHFFRLAINFFLGYWIWLNNLVPLGFQIWHSKLVSLRFRRIWLNKLVFHLNCFFARVLKLNFLFLYIQMTDFININFEFFFGTVVNLYRAFRSR